MTGSVLIYGANGYTGRLIVEEALTRGLGPILAGRDAARLQQVADGVRPKRPLELRVASLTAPETLASALRGVTVVLNAAGPFSQTMAPLAEACLQAGAHYLDITGELEVIESAAALSARARERGVMLMPAVGFDVVPSDCLAAHVARRCPGARALRVGLAGLDLVSRGSARTIVARMGSGTVVRRGGKLQPLAHTARDASADFDFGEGPCRCAAVSWGDVASAFYTTGIPDIAVYFEATLAVRAALACETAWGALVGRRTASALFDRALGLMPSGPSAAQRARQTARLVAEAVSSTGEVVRARLTTPEVYGFTAVAAVAVVERVLAGDLEPGFQTPARVYGADFVLSLPGVAREDL